MIKHFRIRSIYVFVLLTGILHAQDYNKQTKSFLGLEVAASSVNGMKADGLFHEGNGVEYGIRFGAQSSQWRTTFGFTSLDSASDDQNVEKGIFMLDYFFISTHSQNNFRAFIGANVGMINYESTKVDASDFIYGAQVGMIFNVDETIDLDMSYRYSLSSSNQVNDLGAIVFGLNYLY